jgi:hypothetical protein
MLRKPHEVNEDGVAKDFEDRTPGFGLHHPQDRANPVLDGDPSPVEGPPVDKKNPSKQDLGITDAEVLLSIRENRPPRKGY